MSGGPAQASEAAAHLRAIGHITNCFSASLRQRMAALQRPEHPFFSHINGGMHVAVLVMRRRAPYMTHNWCEEVASLVSVEAYVR